MEVKYFLDRRTRFIRDFYDKSAAPFLEVVKKIEAEEVPYGTPPGYGYDYDGEYVGTGEPAFMEEWQDAQYAIQIQGRACLSMLSASLNLYFKTWAHELRVMPPKKKKGEGWLHAYKSALGDRAGIIWDNSPVRLDMIEQIVLARNRDQHPENITSFDIRHSEDDIKTHPENFFIISESETEMLRALAGEDPGDGENFRWILTPAVSVDRDKLFAAIDVVERLCGWLEEQFFEAKYPGSTARRLARGF
ncbi:hypothetical protein PQR12_35525 [Paraburkholderia nemoris]|uniref:hypothetical protein n=1 Tax=Paraburkholderia nemoris TaxID=2793076 RepID=UPI0038BAE844